MIDIGQLNKLVFELKCTGKSDSISGRMNIVTYHWGKCVRDVIYSLRFPEDRKVYLKNAELNIGDTVIMLIMLCQDLGFDFSDVVELGFKHTSEKFKEINEKKSMGLE